MVELLEVSAFSFSKDSERVNQDCVLSPQEINGNYLFAVADGVGSYVGGELASKIAIKQLYKTYLTESSPSFAKVFNDVRQSVLDFSRSDEIYHKAATTLTYVLLADNGLYVGHIGDCRLYIKNGSKLEQLTKDHTQYQRLIEDKLFTKKYLEGKKAKSILTTAIAQDVSMDFDELYIPYENINSEDKSVTLYIMSDGLHSFWERRPRFSENTMSSVTQFSNSLKRRVGFLKPNDDYSLVAVKAKF